MIKEDIEKIKRAAWEKIFNEVYMEHHGIAFRKYLEKVFNRMNDELVERKVEE
jgi:hypothetical protein